MVDHFRLVMTGTAALFVKAQAWAFSCPRKHVFENIFKEGLCVVYWQRVSGEEKVLAMGK